MTLGTQVPKQHIYVMKEGQILVDWGEGEAQDVITGDFLPFVETDIGHTIMDRELDRLVRMGRVLSYDARFVYLGVLPEGKRRMLD